MTDEFGRTSGRPKDPAKAGRDEPAGSAPQDEDPLVELARLVSGERYREEAAPTRSDDDAFAGLEEAMAEAIRYDDDAGAPPDSDRPAAADDFAYPEQPAYAAQPGFAEDDPEPGYEAEPDYGEDDYDAPADGGDYAEDRQDYGADDGYGAEPELPDLIETEPAAEDYSGDPVMAGDYGPYDDGEWQEPAFADDDFDPRAIADAEVEAEPDHYGAGVLPPHSDAEARAVPEMRARKGFVTVAAVLGLVVLGGAVALGYRFLGDGSEEPPPPMIRADTTPTKVKPEDPGGAQIPHQNKQIYDRIGGTDEPAEERIVPREEPVVALNTPADADTGMAGDGVRAVDADGAAPDAAPPAAIPPRTSVEEPPSGPRRVRTVIVKPDGTIVAGEPAGTAPAAAEPPAAETPPAEPPAAETAAAAPPAEPAAAPQAEPVAAPAAEPEPARQPVGDPPQSAVERAEDGSPQPRVRPVAAPTAPEPPATPPAAAVAEPATTAPASPSPSEPAPVRTVRLTNPPTPQGRPRDLPTTSGADAATTPPATAAPRRNDTIAGRVPVQEATRGATRGAGPLALLTGLNQTGTDTTARQAAAPATPPPAPPPAAVPAAAPATQPPPAATTTAAPPSGSYAVQVSSQRSEAEAQQSFANLQRRHPALLGDRTANIRRADLGNRGIFFRVKVVTANRAEARDLCRRLKAEGSDCLVQRN